MKGLVCLAPWCLVLLGAQTVWSQAFPINSDVAIQPAEEQLIYRTQVRYRRFEVETPNADANVWTQSNVFVYGWTSRFSTALGVPLAYRDFDGPTAEDEDFGVKDIRLLLRYQLWKKLAYLESQSWTVLSGAEIPSYDDPFSSRSWDPIVGTVYSYRKNRHGFDADVVYQINTENDRDFEAGDFLKYDLAYQYRLWPAEYKSDTLWTLTGLLELNGEHRLENEMDSTTLDETESHQLFLSPGLVLAGQRTKFEAGVQFPVLRDVDDSAPEDHIRVVVGFTMSF